MSKKKKDVISYPEFTVLNNPTRKRHSPLPDEIISDDENEDSLEETLIGMEYDVDTGEDDWREEEEEDLEEEKEEERKVKEARSLL